jgi:hypothetical protein
MRKLILVIAATIALSSAALAETIALDVKDLSGAEKFVVTDTGLIGLGTSSPAGALHSIGNSYAATQFIGQWNGTPSTANNGGSGFLSFHNNDNNGLPVANDRLGYFLAGSLNGTARLIGGGITMKAEANWTPTFIPTFISFETAATTGRAERVRITGSGNVGIGTTSPSQKLEVVGGLKVNSTLATKTCSSNADRGTMWFTQGGTGTADMLELCVKNANDTYSWKVVVLSP